MYQKTSLLEIKSFDDMVQGCAVCCGRKSIDCILISVLRTGSIWTDEKMYLEPACSDCVKKIESCAFPSNSGL